MHGMELKGCDCTEVCSTEVGQLNTVIPRHSIQCRPHISKGFAFWGVSILRPFVLLLRATCVKMCVEGWCWRGKQKYWGQICLSGHTFLIQIGQIDCWVQAASRSPGAGGCFARVEQPVSEGNNRTFSPLYAFVPWTGTSLSVPIYRWGKAELALCSPTKLHILQQKLLNTGGRFI